MNVKGQLERLDRAQQQRPALAIPIATVKKFGEDKSANMAAMMAFWAFFSIFPLLLAMVTLLGYVLPESEKQRVLEQVAGYVPLLDVSTIGGLQGNVLALVVGVGAALWSGMAVVKVTQYAFNSVWEVPEVERPKMVEQIRRSMLALVTIGLGLVASTLLIGFVSGDNPTLDLGPLSRVLGFAVVIVLDVALFILAFRMLTDREVTTRDVLPGAVFAGVMFWILQSLSSIIITQHLSGAQATYGTFATVITILWWFYLQSQLTLLGAQVNVVLKRGYHPRGLVDAPATEADHRLLDDYASERKFDENEHIDAVVRDEPEEGDKYDDTPEDKKPDADGDADDGSDDGGSDSAGSDSRGSDAGAKSRPASHRAAGRR